MEEELEAFEITDEDLNPFRRKRKFTKKMGIYGIFAPPDSDDDEDTRKSSYSKPVSFVKKGIIEGNVEKEASDDSDVEQEVDVLDAEAAQILVEREDRKLAQQQAPADTRPAGRQLKTGWNSTKDTRSRRRKEAKEKYRLVHFYTLDPLYVVTPWRIILGMFTRL